MQPYELIVIGSGPGGQRAAIQGVKAGKRVALVEKQSAVGGVCTNTGTIPSKTMREAVVVFDSNVVRIYELADAVHQVDAVSLQLVLDY